MHSVVTYIEATEEPSHDLISLEDLKTELGITTTTEDDALQLRITRVSKALAAVADRDFSLRNVVETFYIDYWHPWPTWTHGPSHHALRLHHYPVVSIASVEVNGTETEDYAFDANSGRLWPTAGAWYGTVEVTYTGGYDLPDDAPPILISAVIEAIRQARSFSAADPTIRQLTHGDTSVGYYSAPQGASSNMGFPASVIDSLQPFRRMSA